MLRLFPIVAASALLAALAFACDSDGDGERADETPPAGETPAASPIPEATPLNFTERPEITIEAGGKYVAIVETVKGTFRIELRPDLALQTVNSFIFLAGEGYYDGVTFHRVIPGFMAQGGDPTGTGSGSPGYTLPLEAGDVTFQRGTVGLARGADPNSGGSQFFIAYADAVYDDVDGTGDASVGDVRLRNIGPFLEGSTVAEDDPDIGSGLTTVSHLDGGYTVFGTVTEGMEVVDALTARDPDNFLTPQPETGDQIISIKIEEAE
jgi:peptidylprolyl isomerase